MPAEIEVVQPQAITPMQLLEIATSQGADVDKLQKLWELQQQWEKVEAKKAYDAAMSEFKKMPPRINKNRHVKFGQTEYDHATLDHVTDAITAALSKVGISHKWAVKQDEKGIAVTCILTHTQGHSETTTLSAGADTSGSKNSIQAIGSTVTYLQRYTILAATGLAAAGTDNDGATAGKALADERYIVLLEAIEGAPNRKDLQAAFATAWKESGAINDGYSKTQFQKAYDAKKVAL